MELVSRPEGDVWIVKIKGSLNSNTSVEADARIIEAITNGTTKMIIDLTETEFVSSSGLRVFLSTAKQLSKTGGLVLVNPNKVVKEILDISGFSTIINVQNSIEDGLSQF